MFIALDLTATFAGAARYAGDISALRPLFYGTVPPPEFLMRSVDGARAADSEEFSNSLSPLHWLGPVRDAVAQNGMGPESVVLLKAAFARALDCSLSPRERLELWYCLRLLNEKPPEAEADRVLGVIFEFPQATSTGLLAVYSDRFSCGVWEGGSCKWPAYEEGAPSLLAQEILRGVSMVFPHLPAPVPEPLELPPLGHVLLTVLTPSGFRSVLLPLASVSETDFLDLYNSGASLFSLLFAAKSEDQLYSPPMDLEDPQWQFAPLAVRAQAFLADCFLFGILVGLFGYFTYPVLRQWGYTAMALGAFFCIFAPPLLSAWMESSDAWGYRTFGKRMFSLGVCSTYDSSGLTFPQALARNCGKWFVSPLFLGCGFVWAAFHRYRRAWHDIFADTVVLSLPDDAEE